MGKSRPKTGERRQIRQPLKIDKLPVEMRDRIQAERAAGRTWEEIEEMSPEFAEWDKVPDAAKKLFPDGFLPHTTLARWWDLRVDQVRREVMKQAEAAKGLAVAFAGRSMEQTPEAVMNAYRDLIFSVLEQSDAKSKSKVIKNLADLGWLVNDSRKVEIKERAQKTAERALELRVEQMTAKVVTLKKDVEKKKLTPGELKKKLDEIYGLGAA